MTLQDQIEIKFPNGIETSEKSEELEGKIHSIIETYSTDRASIRSNRTGNQLVANPTQGETQ